METTIKDQVKNIFKTNAFETALNLTRNLRGEYIKEYGVKSWNALVSYYKKANIQPVAEVAEQEAEYKAESYSTQGTEEVSEINPEEVSVITEEVGEETPASKEVSEVNSSTEKGVGEENASEQTSEEAPDADKAQEEVTIEYMLYQNDGDKVDWYGHYANYKGLKVGESGMMIRMNNLGIGKGKVLATASMTIQEIGIFHKCYASIRQSTLSDKKRVELFTQAFNNLQDAVRDPKFVSHSTGKAMTNFILNYKKED